MSEGSLKEKFVVRGIGLEWNLPCFVSGTPDSDRKGLKPNIAAFVESKEAGERVVAMFNGLASLDYREREPNWIQVKVGAEEKYKPALEALGRLVRQNGNEITPEIIQEARAGIEL